MIATSEEVITAIRSWRAAGKTLPEMEAMLQGEGITMVRSTIWKYCNDIALPNASKRNTARRLAVSGWTLAKIAAELGVSVCSVQRWCVSLGLKRGRRPGIDGIKPTVDGVFGNGATKR